MKKCILIILLIISFLLVNATIAYTKKDKEIEEIKAIYISYIEYLDNFYGNSKTINETKIDKMIDNLSNYNFNTILLHVSPFSDSIYPSKIFPYTHTLTGVEGKNPGFDYLDYFIKKSHQRRIKVYAWINPYRIRSDNNIDKLSTSNPAYPLIDTSSVLVSNSGIYYNPASELVKNLIINQVKEIINNYDIDGIHFDDYFYTNQEIDKEEYTSHLRSGGKYSLEEFRLYHTNDLIKRVYRLIKEKDHTIIFSISPDGNINNNYKYHYADVKTWLSSNEYIDMIMPQIYFGFENQYKPYEKTLLEWKKLISNESIQMIPILAFYKVGNIDKEAGSGQKEWVNNNDIIKRQIEYSRKEELKGFGVFRYDYLFNTNYHNNISIKELVNMRKIF